MKEFYYIFSGYLLGSILFANLVSRILKTGNITDNSADKNPGTANAFRNGGFWCGILTLCGDILKGFLPVWLYLSAAEGQMHRPSFAFILAAPVIGHIFPVFYRFHGGKGIATTFGCLLGLLPYSRCVLILACCFIFFSCVVRISPNYYRTLCTYLCTMIFMRFLIKEKTILLGFALISLAVGYRLLTSKEEKESCKVILLWKH